MVAQGMTHKDFRGVRRLCCALPLPIAQHRAFGVCLHQPSHPGRDIRNQGINGVIRRGVMCSEHLLAAAGLPVQLHGDGDLGTIGMKFHDFQMPWYAGQGKRTHSGVQPVLHAELYTGACIGLRRQKQSDR